MKACALSLAINNGRRKAELARFKVSYFDKENLICEGALYKTPEKMMTKGRGSRGKMLDVYTLAKSFQPYLDLWLEERKKLNIKSDWLFPKYKDGQWIDEQVDTVLFDSWGNTFSRILEKPFYWHSLRHYFTTKLLESNLPESVVQDIIGWSSSDMLRIYDDRSTESQFDKYFGADGIKGVKQSTLTEL
jgi:integrase